MKKTKHIFNFITSFLITLSTCLTTSQAVKGVYHPDSKIDPIPQYHRTDEQPTSQPSKYNFSSFGQASTKNPVVSKNTPSCIHGAEVNIHKLIGRFLQSYVIDSRNLDKYFEVNYSIYYYTNRSDGSYIFCKRLFIKPKKLGLVLQKEVLEQYLNERKKDILKKLHINNSSIDNILDVFDLIVMDRRILMDKNLHYALNTSVRFKDFDCASKPPQILLEPDYLYANFELYIKRYFIEFESRYCPSILYLVKRDSLFPV